MDLSRKHVLIGYYAYAGILRKDSSYGEEVVARCTSQLNLQLFHSVERFRCHLLAKFALSCILILSVFLIVCGSLSCRRRSPLWAKKSLLSRWSVNCYLSVSPSYLYLTPS